MSVSCRPSFKTGGTARRRRHAAVVLLAAAVLLVGGRPLGAVDGRKVPLSVVLHSGAAVNGRLLEYDDVRLLLEVQDHVVAVAWDSIRTPHAYKVKKKIIELERGGLHSFTAEDHYQLGYFLAVRNNHSAAISEFRKAERLDPAYAARVKEAWREIRRRKEQARRQGGAPLHDPPGAEAAPPAMGRTRDGMIYRRYDTEQHRRAITQFRRLGEQVRTHIAPELVVLETRHFMIWTDWPESKRQLLSRWAEQMYSLMCQEFGFPDDEPIWLGKCPLFIFWHKSHFEKFASLVDDYERSDTLGYTKTTTSGYVHVVLRRLGNNPGDLNRFATTMVHEASHAFMHCYGSSRSLPPWLSEGLADYIAERVLQDRCETGEISNAVARKYVAEHKPIAKLFDFEESPPGQYYPIAHSLVRYLIERDHPAFVALINDLKQGSSLKQSLARNYKGMNLRTLEHGWRVWIRKTAGR